MPHRTFLAFIWPSLFAMLLFIALPIVSVAYQSLFIEHEQVMVEVENCGPFGCEGVPNGILDERCQSTQRVLAGARASRAAADAGVGRGGVPCRVIAGTGHERESERGSDQDPSAAGHHDS